MEVDCPTHVDVLIVGGGPAGLMAATALANYKCKICLVESMPTIGRKFLMAGKSGLNITTSRTDFLEQYGDSAQWISPIIENFGPKDIIQFCESLGQNIFVGSSGRVFPKSMKTSPLLRAWLARLKNAQVEIRTSAKWIDFNKDNVFSSKQEENLSLCVSLNGIEHSIMARAVIFALGGASWTKLGSDGKWSNVLKKYFYDSQVSLVPFRASNMGLTVIWSKQMLKFEGEPVKSIAVKVNGTTQKGEFIVTRAGVEGGIIYSLSTSLLGTVNKFELDLLPDISLLSLCKKLDRNRGKSSMSNFLRKAVGLNRVKFGLLREFAHPFPGTYLEFARIIKNLEIKVHGNYSMDYAISTKGGIAKGAVNRSLMLTDLPGVFCAGEMLDWTAPTGGGLLTGCFSTGSYAGNSVAKYLNLKLIS